MTTIAAKTIMRVINCLESTETSGNRISDSQNASVMKYSEMDGLFRHALFEIPQAKSVCE